MSYLKLCQLLSQSETEVYYLEDSDGLVLVDTSPAFPLTLQCEVIDWTSRQQYEVRGTINSFDSVIVTIEEAPVDKTLREAVYEQLLVNYPSLEI